MKKASQNYPLSSVVYTAWTLLAVGAMACGDAARVPNDGPQAAGDSRQVVDIMFDFSDDSMVEMGVPDRSHHDMVRFDGPGSVAYVVGRDQLTFQHAAGELPAEVYYPRAAAHPSVVAPGRFPVVVVAHGYIETFLDYAYLAHSLTTNGAIVVLPTKRSTDATIPLDAYGAELAFLLEAMQRLGTDSGSPFWGHIANRSALLGHSAGAGASILAAVQAVATAKSSLTTVVALAPLGITYGTISGPAPNDIAKGLALPVLVLEGAKDCVCPPAGHSRKLYQNLAGPKHLVTLREGDHCGFGDASGPRLGTCELAEGALCLLTPQGQTLSNGQQNLLTQELVAPWLAHFLEDEEGAWDRFSAVAQDARLTHRFSP